MSCLSSSVSHCYCRHLLNVAECSSLEYSSLTLKAEEELRLFFVQRSAENNGFALDRMVSGDSLNFILCTERRKMYSICSREGTFDE